MENKKYYWFVFSNEQLLLKKEGDTYTIPYQENNPTPVAEWTRIHELTYTDGEIFKCYAVDYPLTNLPEGYETSALRPTYLLLPHHLYQMAGKGAEILYWDQNSKYCPVCGMPMKFHTAISKRCTGCGKEIWPSVATAIIVRIEKENKILMVHARNFRGDFFGLVAGFVETGETLEECVHREVMEETGLHIKNVKYFGSQPWPYPCGLMVGFTAEYESGDIKLQNSELSAGSFFSKDNLPQIPGKASLARALIDDWLNKKE